MISVVVPVYKVEPFLHQCVDSILSQTYSDIEILLIDDASPDKCGEICEDYAKKDKRISVFHTENRGLSAARNLGLRKAKGEFIGFVDSDDWIEPNMYEVLLRQLENHKSDVSVCGFLQEYKKNKEEHDIYHGVFTSFESIRNLVCDSTTVWNKLYKKECWANVWFPEGHLYEDVATIYKVILNAHFVSYTSNVLYHYRMRTGSIVHVRTMKNLMDFWNAHYTRYLFLSEFPEVKNDKEIINKLEERVANAAARTWRWCYKLSGDQRNYDFLRMVSCYVKKHYPVFGRKNWNLSLRVCIFFCRYLNDVSFAILYAMSKSYRYVMRFQNNTRFTHDY